MKLRNLIKKKFMPPFAADNSIYHNSDIEGYTIQKKDGKFLPTLAFKDDEIMCPNAYENTNVCWDYMNGLAEDERDWTYGIEEAREAAWENFENNYSEDVVRV